MATFAYSIVGDGFPVPPQTISRISGDGKPVPYKTERYRAAEDNEKHITEKRTELWINRFYIPVWMTTCPC